MIKWTESIGNLFKKKDLYTSVHHKEEVKQTNKFVKDPKSERKVVKYTYTPDYFVKWSGGHRMHQQKSLSAIKHNGKIGQINLPTGTGKTRIQISLHIEDMIKKTNNGKLGVYAITAHRLTLRNQLLEEFLDVAVKTGVKFDILLIGTGKQLESSVYTKYNNDYGFSELVSSQTITTDTATVDKAHKAAIKKGRHLMIVSTYHSFDVINTGNLKVDICTFDEAHTIVNGKEDNEIDWSQFYSNLLAVKSMIKREYFFTATPRTVIDSDGNSSMYEDVFGPCLYSAPFADMVDAGEIVHPKFHFVSPKNLWAGVDESDVNEKYNNPEMLYRLVTESFTEHKKHLHKLSADSSQLGAKLLITAKNISQVNAIIKSIGSWSNDENIKVFGIHSDMKADVGSVLEEIRNLNPYEDAIIVHVRMIAEGIDIPSVTGILPLVTFRDNEARLIQTVGRPSRLHPTDRYNLYNGVISPREYSAMIKPHSMIILPHNFFNENDQTEVIKNIITTLSTEYNIPITDMFINISDKEETRSKGDTSGKGEKPKPFSWGDMVGEDELIHIMETITTNEYNRQVYLNKNPKPTILNDLMLTVDKRYNPATPSAKEKGERFEKLCCDYLCYHGWDAEITPSSNDKGADIVAVKDDRTVVIQCKDYEKNVGYHAVQEVYAARDYWSVDSAVVVCSSEFTKPAKDGAERLGVVMINDFTKLSDLESILK